MAALLIYGHLSMAQNHDVGREIQRIDSLIEYNQFDKAEKKTDSLYQLLENKYEGEDQLEQRLKVRLQQGILLDNKFDHKKALHLFLEVAEKAEKYDLHRLLCISYIKIALEQEKTHNYYLAYNYIKDARKLCKEYQFDDLYSTIFIRYALLHRFLGEENSVFVNPGLKQRIIDEGFVGSIDSAVFYAEKSIEYANKYNNEVDMNNANILMGILYGKKRKNRIPESTAYFLKVITYYKKVHNFEGIGVTYRNIAMNYLQNEDAKTALIYNDSAYTYYRYMPLYYKYVIPQNRSEIFDTLGKTDSAYYYFKIAYEDEIESYKMQEVSETKKLEEQFQNDKKDSVIKSKNQLLIFILILVIVIAIASLLLILKNRKINSQNKIINKQLEELLNTLDQKQVILSELQHRVKNNLQHVISILEIQKESIDFNNIDEVIRSNQNRIHSMALLHKKLNLSESVNDIDLCRYITELSELVKESYDTYKKKIQLNISCEVEKISIENALPTGLIIVELISNSIKHAFKNRNIGIITIAITKDKSNEKNKLYYSDNGSGFDFSTISEKGLGLEITRGLIDQLNGEITTKSNDGFELTIWF